jgi:FMN phosphatase YigB (HAD superfamily)
MIEVLVSDLGQVLLPFDFSPVKAFMRARCGYARSGPEDDSWIRLVDLNDRTGFGIGNCSADAFYRRVQTEMQMDATYEEFCRIWSDVFQEDHEALELVRRAPVRYRFLLSNTNIIHWDWIVRKHGAVLSVFDRLLPSQETGLLKPDPQIYRHVESLTGLPPAAHLLIDDGPENVEAARACGWDGIVYTAAEELAQELRRRGLA